MTITTWLPGAALIVGLIIVACFRQTRVWTLIIMGVAALAYGAYLLVNSRLTSSRPGDYEWLGWLMSWPVVIGVATLAVLVVLLWKFGKKIKLGWLNPGKGVWLAFALAGLMIASEAYPMALWHDWSSDVWFAVFVVAMILLWRHIKEASLFTIGLILAMLIIYPAFIQGGKWKYPPKFVQDVYQTYTRDYGRWLSPQEKAEVARGGACLNAMWAGRQGCEGVSAPPTPPSLVLTYEQPVSYALEPGTSLTLTYPAHDPAWRMCNGLIKDGKVLQQGDRAHHGVSIRIWGNDERTILYFPQDAKGRLDPSRSPIIFMWRPKKTSVGTC